MKNFSDADVRRWLDRHAHELEPEEILFEEEKAAIAAACAGGRWPSPVPVSSMTPFDQICDEASFNRIVGDPGLWERLLARKDLYECWVRPQAVLLFGKKWFDGVKWKPTIWHSVPLPLFSDDEKAAARAADMRLEDTDAGRSRIARIISKVEHALDMYLRGGGRAPGGGVKRPGGYITDAVRNHFVRELARDLGYRAVRVPTCPACLSRKAGHGRRRRQPPLLELSAGRWSCPDCAEKARNISLHLLKDGSDGGEIRRLKGELRLARLFSDAPGVFCVCPGSRCHGRLVPMNAVRDPGWWSTRRGRAAAEALAASKPMRGSAHYRKPEGALSDIPLECPFCGERFTPARGTALRSGFKRMSGMLTGPPSVHVWKRMEDRILDRTDPHSGANTRPSMKDSLAAEVPHPADRIALFQKAEIAAGETLLRMASCRPDAVPGILSRCFYAAVLGWIRAFPEDAARYFFESGGDETRRGSEAAVHQSVVRLWLQEISRSLPELSRAKGKPRMASLEDVPWLCRRPKFPSGPVSSFAAPVGPNLSVPSRSSLKSPSGGHRPRIALLLSVEGPDGADLMEHVSSCEWHLLRISSEAGLSEGDKVRVRALMMPGHHSHAPIKRIMRFRTDIMEPLAQRLRQEEESGERDQAFWRSWTRRVAEARGKMEKE